MSHFEDKFHLTPEQSVFLAKKHWDENIYCGMRMENRAITFPQTRTILSGVNVPNVQLDDIQAVLNMRDAWKYLLSSLNEPVSLAYMCKLNEFIARNEALEWGKLRTGKVSISGTEYIPPVPTWEAAEREFESIMFADTSTTEKALNLFAWGTRSQLFWDGNKRTSMTIANRILIDAGAGMLTISDRHMEQFNTLLVEYYNTGEVDALKQFLYDHAIQGIEI